MTAAATSRTPITGCSARSQGTTASRIRAAGPYSSEKTATPAAVTNAIMR